MLLFLLVLTVLGLSTVQTFPELMLFVVVCWSRRQSIRIYVVNCIEKSVCFMFIVFGVYFNIRSMLPESLTYPKIASKFTIIVH